MNCAIVVEQVETNLTTTAIYKFNDYKVATAIQNILDNVRYKDKNYFTRKSKSKKEIKNMSIEDAMGYISDLINVYLKYLPIPEGYRKCLITSLNLSLGALKTIDDMQTKGR